MDKDELILLVEDLVTVPHCCTELKEAGQKWIASVGTPDEKAAAESLIAEIEEDHAGGGRDIILTCGSPLPEIMDFEEG